MAMKSCTALEGAESDAVYSRSASQITRSGVVAHKSRRRNRLAKLKFIVAPPTSPATVHSRER
eukprot:5178175-Prymnesium_polylepis.1